MTCEIIRTGEVDEVHDARLLAVAVVGLDELVERDGDDRVSSTARGVHVGRRHRPTRRPCSPHTYTYTHTAVLSVVYETNEPTTNQNNGACAFGRKFS